MSKSARDRDPSAHLAKRQARRKAHREAVARGVQHLEKQPRASRSQMSHASSGKAIKQRREGQRAMERDR